MPGPPRLEVRRSLLLHRAVMDHVARDPSLLERARRRVAEWRREGSVALPHVEAWEQFLALPLDELTRAVLEESDAGHDRRQVSPFAGVLDPRERWRILREAGSSGGGTPTSFQRRRLLGSDARRDEGLVRGSCRWGRPASLPALLRTLERNGVMLGLGGPSIVVIAGKDKPFRAGLE